MPTTRASLIKRCQNQSDEASWQEFYDCYSPVVRRYIQFLGVPANDVEDVVQEIFVRLWVSLGKMSYDRSRGRFRTWLRRVAHNMVVDHFRKRKNVREHSTKAEILQQVEARSHQTQFDLECAWRAFEFAAQQIRSRCKQTTWDCYEQHGLHRRPAKLVAQELGVDEQIVFVNSSRVSARISRMCSHLKEELADDLRP